MVTEVVQFREDKAELDFLRGLGVNPNDLAREAFDQAMRIVRANERMKRIRELRFKLSPEVDFLKLIRDDRESH